MRCATQESRCGPPKMSRVRGLGFVKDQRGEAPVTLRPEEWLSTLIRFTVQLYKQQREQLASRGRPGTCAKHTSTQACHARLEPRPLRKKCRLALLHTTTSCCPLATAGTRCHIAPRSVNQSANLSVYASIMFCPLTCIAELTHSLRSRASRLLERRVSVTRR